MPTNTFQFETCDVQFWKNDNSGEAEQARATAAHATWRQRNGSTRRRQAAHAIPEEVAVSSGQYSVAQARGNEHLSDVRQEIQRTFYTVVTKPQRLLDEYEAQEVYVPSRSVSQDPAETARRRDSTVRVSVRSEGSANGHIRTANTTAGASLTLPRVKNHTIRATDTVPIVRVPPRPSPSRVETSHVVTGSLSRKLNDVSGRSVVRDSQSGRAMMASRAGSQPPAKVTYQYKVDASERRIEYRYHSETLLYDFEETTKREQLETWQSQHRAPASGATVTTVRKTKSLQETTDPLQGTPTTFFFVGTNMDSQRRLPRIYHDFEEDDDADFRSSTWNFIENSSRRSESFVGTPSRPDILGGRGISNGLETTTGFRELPSTPVSATRTASTYQFHYVTRRVSTGARHTTVELEHSARDLPNENEHRVEREIPVQMVVGNGTGYSRYSLAADVVQRCSTGGISPQQRLSSYSLHSIVDERDNIQKKTFTKWVNKHLTKTGLKVDDLFVDLRDGYALIALLEALTGERIQKENGYTRFHRIQNVQYCLDFLKRKNIKLVNIRPEDIVEGNGKLTLGLIWTIILNFQVSVIRQRLLLESQHEMMMSSSATSTTNRQSVSQNKSEDPKTVFEELEAILKYPD
ncbi:unnamed protein product [Caenorhabditis sp. 36 PRJEB53466]|nr:unnamed protein product [Caenorhabditis sp. 36 PRJEB53466]